VQYENGSILCPDYNNATAFDKDGNELKRFAVPKGKEKESESLPTGEEFSENHFGNFIDCVRSKDPTKLHAPILEGHISSALCHTGNISYRLGKKASPDELREAVKGNKEAMDSLERLFTHLAANDVKVDVDKLSLGQFLKMDPKTERFIDNAEADKLLTREYRAPFVVPEIA
jgi:hypothetical protein